MNGNRMLIILALLCLLALTGLAQAQGLKIEKGFDVFRTLRDFDTEQSFIDCPIPGLIFEENSSSPLSGCSFFNGLVKLEGKPLGRFRGITVGAVDTIVERTSTLDFGLPDMDATLMVEVELLALNLVSVAPIEVACNEGPTHWAVKVQVDEITGPSLGEMAVTLKAPDFAGGTVSSELPVCPRVTFTRVDPGTSGSFEIFPCDLQCGPNLFGDTTWSFQSPTPGGVLKIEDFTTANFNFTEQPAEPSNLCPSIYPHQEATAAHLGCQPDPCARDIEPPNLMVPAPKTCECSAQGGSPISDPCVANWLRDVFCLDELSNSTCGPLDPPNFYPSACNGHDTIVTFFAKDECGNSTTAQSTLTIRDSKGPVVEAGKEDLYCLWPPNHSYRTFKMDEFSPAISDACGSVAGWRFVDCKSDQPEKGPGDNTVDDCIVATDGKTFKVRSERQNPVPAGRRYAVEIRATDSCGNVGDSAVIGFIHVPHSQKDARDRGCLEPDK